jgi:hypothetical protein
MKKLFGLENPEEARGFSCAVLNITSCNRSVGSGTAKYVIFYLANAWSREGSIQTRPAAWAPTFGQLLATSSCTSGTE